MKYPFIIYLLAMAITTYLIRLLPLILIKKKITNRYVLSFLNYVPYAVLTAMTIPAIFSAAGSPVSSTCGLLCGLILAYNKKSLLMVAFSSVGVVLIVECLLSFIF